MPRPSLRTGRADLPHPALRSRLGRLAPCGAFAGYRSRGAPGGIRSAPRPPLCPAYPKRVRASPRPCWPRRSSPVGNRWRFSDGACLPLWFRSLPPLAPRALPRFSATTAALTAARRRWRGFLPGQLSTVRHDTFPAFPPQPSPATPALAFDEGCRPDGSPLPRQASPFARRLAVAGNRIGFTCVRDRGSASGCSPPRLAATQLPPAALP